MMDSDRRRVALWGFALLLALIVPCAIFILAFEDRTGNKNDYPSDSDQPAIDFFHAHRDDFENMRSLIESHPFVFLAAERGRAESPPDAFRDAPAAKEELLRLMQTLRLPWINGTQSGWGIKLTFLSSGMDMGGTSKSFYYICKTPQKNLVPSTEAFRPNTTGSSSVFRPIESGWYLQLEWGRLSPGS